MKTLLIFFVLICSIPLSAQITKENWLVGGNLGFNKSSSQVTRTNYSTEVENYQINLDTNIGYFPLDKFAVGFAPYFRYNIPVNGINSYSFLFGPFIRYYFLESDNLINIFSHVEYQYGNYYTDGKKQGYNSNFNFRVGPSIFFNKSVAIEFTLEYQMLNTVGNQSPKPKTKVQNLTFGVGFQIHLQK